MIRNHQNLGIAAALNLGVKHAIGVGFDWVCTFDQDSRVSEGFIFKMLETYQQAPHPEKVALLAPSYRDRGSGVDLRLERSGQWRNTYSHDFGEHDAIERNSKAWFF